MEFCIKKFAMIITKSGKREITEGIKLPNQERIKFLSKERKSQADTVNLLDMKEKKRR